MLLLEAILSVDAGSGKQVARVLDMVIDVGACSDVPTTKDNGLENFTKCEREGEFHDVHPGSAYDGDKVFIVMDKLQHGEDSCGDGYLAVPSLVHEH